MTPKCSGFTKDDSLIGTQIFLPAPDLFAVVRDLWPVVGPYALLQRHTSEISAADVALATRILEQYCGPLELLAADSFESFTKMADDSFFFYGVHKFLELHTQHSTGNTFFYNFKYFVRRYIIFLKRTLFLKYNHCPGRAPQRVGPGCARRRHPRGGPQ